MEWQDELVKWKQNHPDAAAEFSSFNDPINEQSLRQSLEDLEIAKNKATRSQSAQCLQHLAQVVPNLIGGSADLSCSDNTFLKNYATISAEDYLGRNIKYGVREFAMSCIATGMVLTNMYRPYIGTFLMFSDYMRNGIRLSALMNLPVIYQFTHDSIFLGEDGPTHQPVEHLASLRAMPNLTVCRPADENEVKAAWHLALTSKAPTAIILSRQNIVSLEESNFTNALKGAYVLKDAADADITIFSSGSECDMALTIANELSDDGIKTRLVSMMSWEQFAKQDDSYQDDVIGNAPLNVSIEAGSTLGWERYVGRNGVSIGIDSFGLSAPIKDLKQHFGFTSDQIIKKIKAKMATVAVG